MPPQVVRIKNLVYTILDLDKDVRVDLETGFKRKCTDVRTYRRNALRRAFRPSQKKEAECYVYDDAIDFQDDHAVSIIYTDCIETVYACYPFLSLVVAREEQNWTRLANQGSVPGRSEIRNSRGQQLHQQEDWRLLEGRASCWARLGLLREIGQGLRQGLWLRRCVVDRSWHEKETTWQGWRRTKQEKKEGQQTRQKGSRPSQQECRQRPWSICSKGIQKYPKGERQGERQKESWFWRKVPEVRPLNDLFILDVSIF